jgi:hypothetical protein
MKEMSRTDNLSIVASLLGFLLAVYSIFTQPILVESARPTQTGSGEITRSEEPAYARLWDDPFAVYSDIYSPHPERPQPPSATQRTLFLIIPTKTFAYEEDKENRLRIRYAVERAPFDQGFVPRSANFLSTIKLASCKESTEQTENVVSTDSNDQQSEKLKGPKRSAPVQIFTRSWPICGATDLGASEFSAAVVIWLPDSYMWTLNRPADSRDNLQSAFRSIQEQFPEKRNDRWVLLGPSDSDSLAYFERHSNSLGKPEIPLWVVPYRATIAQTLLERIVETKSSPDSHVNLFWPSFARLTPALRTKETKQADLTVIRFPNGDDVLCLELLRAVKNHNISLLGSNPLKVLIFAEWDTLYGRALAETFTALADRDNSFGRATGSLAQETFHRLKESVSGYDAELLDRLQGGTTVQVRIVPYLRGLDGASTLYRKAYSQSAVSNSDKDSSKAGDGLAERAKTPIEAAEGTSQFDYIRRLIESDYKQRFPFWHDRTQPDAIILFGTDVYDKLALLEFLRQELRNPLYLTTDLDALYWHPHYLKYTKNLVVASPFPLRMDPAWCRGEKGNTANPIEFRDIHQSAIYLAVNRCLGEKEIGPTTFDWSGWPRLYTVGNSRPLPIRFADEPTSAPSPGQPSSKNLDGGWLAQLTQGTSFCFSLAFQLTVVLLGFFAIRSLPSRITLGQAVSEEVWSSAMLGLSDKRRARVEKLRSGIREKWARLNRYRVSSETEKSQASQTVTPPAVADSDPSMGKLDRDLASYEQQLLVAKYKKDIVLLALRLLSTLFRAKRKNAPEDSKLSTSVKHTNLHGFLGSLFRLLPEKSKADDPEDFGLEVTPFVEFVARDLSLKPWIIQIYPNKFGQPFIKPVQWIDRRFPTLRFTVLAAILFFLMSAVCLHPTAYLLGPETISTLWRTTRWLVESTALLVIFLVIHRVCYEQFRFRKLIEGLAGLIEVPAALSNRQLLILLAEASTPIANLALTPGALLFLIYLSHLPFFGGAPLSFELVFFLLVALGILAYSYVLVRNAALDAAERVKSAYQQDTTDAIRFGVRLQSYVKRDRPLQDDEASLERDLQKLIERSSTLDTSSKLRPGDLRSDQVRNQCAEYLKALEGRNREYVESLSGIRDGLFAPLIANPLVAALIIPLGGASGLNLIQWLVSFVR